MYLPEANFSIWSVPYLLSRGFDVATIVEFARRAHPMLIDAFHDSPADETNNLAHLAELFEDSPHAGLTPDPDTSTHAREH